MNLCCVFMCYVFGFSVFWFGLEVLCSFWTRASVPTFDMIFGNNHLDGVLMVQKSRKKTNSICVKALVRLEPSICGATVFFSLLWC